MDKKITDFIKNYKTGDEKTYEKHSFICGVCSTFVDDEFPIYTVAEIGRVCSLCYRMTTFQALLLSRFVDEG